jgi:hypothetical protein
MKAPFVHRLTILATLVFAACPAWASETQVGTLYTSLSSADMQELLDAMRLANSRAYGGPGGPAWQIQLGGFETVLFLDDCDSDQCGSVQMWAGFTPDGTVVLAQLNSWNKEHRFSRAYVSEDGVVHLESDLDMTGGVSLRAVVEQIRTFRASAGAFSSHLNSGTAPR